VSNRARVYQWPVVLSAEPATLLTLGKLLRYAAAYLRSAYGAASLLMGFSERGRR
jgi:hypothetical protein